MSGSQRERTVSGRRRRVLGSLGVIAITLATVVLTSTQIAEAAVVKSFTPRFRTNDTGDVIFASNTLMTCAASSSCTTAQGQTSLSNNDFNSQWVDVDGVAATANSSSATLTIPSGATVLWAGLYWAGSTGNTDASRASVRLAAPGAAYTSLTGEVTTGKVATLGGYPYSGFVDVTSLVQTSGSYTVGGVASTVGVNARAGWSIVVVIRDPTLPLRNLSVFDGYAEINSGETTVTTTVSGFLTPSTGTVNARIGAVVSEGDAGLTGDALRFNGVTLSDALNPASNFFNSSISRLGTRVTAKNPDYVNQFGYDTDYLVAPAGAIGNGQTSATVSFTTGGESYEPIALFTAIDIYEPNVAVTKTVAKVGTGTKVNPGDQIQYTITASSTGSESAATTVLLDPIPSGTTYVAGSTTVDGVAVTDTALDDRGEFNSSTGQVTLRLGTGATSVTGGTVLVGASTTVRFRVQVNASIAVGALTSNQATVTYRSPTTGTLYTSLSDDPNIAGALNATTLDVNDAPVATAVTRTIPEDTSTTIALTDATSDPDGDTLTFGLTGTVPTGVTCTAAGACSYAPPANFNGAVSFTYVATDPGGRTATNTVSITVSPVNDPPVANDDPLTTPEDTNATVNVVANDTDIDGGALSVASWTQGTKGTVTCAGTSCTYRPNLNANGTDSFTYVVSDGNGGSATATVRVTITAVNDAPTATGGTFTTNEDTAISIDVLDGDADVDGQTVRLSSFTQPAHGVLACTALTGPCTYTPVANYNGPDSFTYTIDDGPGGLTATATINLTVTPVNDLPTVVNDAATTAEDNAVSLNVLTNDSDIDGDVLRIASYTQPARGTVTCVLATGSCTYTPALNYNGADLFTYELSDGNGGQRTGRVTLTVTAVNDAPVAVNDVTATDEDTAVTVAVLANDTDVDGDTLNIRTVTVAPTNGTVTCTTTCTYRPNANFNGTDSFTYQIADRSTGGLTATAVVTITVNAVNDAPVAVADTVAATEDTTTATFNVLTNDLDVDDANGTLRLASNTQPAHGSVACTALGACAYTPAPNYNGPDSFSYVVRDPSGATSTATVTVTVAAVNDVPQASPDSATTTEDTPITIDVSAGDLDVDGDVLTYALVTGPAHGTVTCQTNGSCTYTPALDYNGPDSFTYRVSDPSSASATATVTITVGSVNDAPVATDGTATTAEDTPVPVNPLALATDPDGDTLQLTAVGTPRNGTVSCGPLPGSGPCSYTPRANFNGTDSFTYTVVDPSGAGATATITVTVTAVNDPPVAVDDSVTTAEDNAATFSIAANDSDVDGDTLTFSIVGTAPVGMACSASGACTYTPPANFNGTITFDYLATDIGGLTDTGSVIITVTAVNDAPTAASPTVTVAEDVELIVNLLGLAGTSDLDGDALTITAVSTPSTGTLACATLPGPGPCTFTPAPNVNGTTTFTYTVSDGNGGSATGTVTIVVTPVNDAPLADPDSAVTDEDTAVVVDVLDGDTDIDGDALTILSVTQPASGTVTCEVGVPGGTCTYTPAANSNGADSFTYTVTDGNGATAIGTVSILVRSINDAPVAAPDSTTVAEDGSVDIAVLTNDSDIDGDPLTISAVTQPAHGTVDCTTTPGTCRYVPAANFDGTDTFGYTISDGQGASAATTVTVTVTPVNDPPIGLDRTVVTREDVATPAFDVVGGATDIDGDTVVLTGYTGPPPAQGTVSCTNAAGTCTFVPAPNFNGSSSFVVTLSDGTATTTATVTVVVTAVNDLPVANDDTETTDEDTPIEVFPLVNDTDVDAGDTLSIVPATTATANGAVVCTSTSCTYTPRANFNGTDSFTYDVVDSSGARAAATVRLTIDAVNDPPEPGDGVGVTKEDTPLTVPVSYVLANDVDPDMYDAVPDVIEAISFTQPVGGGSVSCLPFTPPYRSTDLCTFTPAPNSTATVTFTYTVRDRAGATASATITVLVDATNDPPVAADDAVTTDEDVPVTITAATLLANDTDPDLPADTLTIQDKAPRRTAFGSVTCSAAGCTYTPDADANGTDSFTYDVADALGALSSATVVVTVSPVNDAPTPQPGAGTTPEDTTLFVPVSFVLANDTDPDGDALTAISFTQPPFGGTTACTGFQPTDICSFVPAPNFVGTTTFTYTVTDGQLTASAVITVYVTAVNDPPVAGDDTAATQEDVPLTIAAADLLADDSDIDSATLTIQASSTDTPNGHVECTAAGCTYTPNANFNGTDQFTYTIGDGDGATASATVTVTVDAVNDVPRTPGFAIETDEDTAATVDVLAGATDVDDTTLTASLDSGPANGTVTCLPAGTCTYTPNPGYNGSDSFVYRISDGRGGEVTGTVAVTVNPINDLPIVGDDARTMAEDDGPLVILVLGNDSDPDGDTLTVVANAGGLLGTLVCSSTSCAYTPTANANGIDTISYTVSDGNGGTRSGNVVVTITAVNDAPEAAALGITTAEDTAVPVNLLAGASDVDGDTLTVTVVSGPAVGTLSCDASVPSSCTYTPPANFAGSATIEVDIADGNGGVVRRTILLTITPINDPPVTAVNAATTAEDTPADIDVLAGATDADPGDVVSFVSATPGTSGGVVTCTAAGLCTYAPPPDFFGTDTFTYTVVDASGAAVTTTVTVTVTPVNDPPVDVAVLASVDEDAAGVDIDPLAAVTDIDSTTLTILTVPDPDHGTFTCTPVTGPCRYVPDADFRGTDTFGVVVGDGNGGQTTVQITVTVSSVNDLPVAVDDATTIDEDSLPVVIAVLGNDSDIDGDALTVVAFTNPANGTVSCTQTACTYTPNPNFHGDDTFTYTVSDGNMPAGTASATVTVTVRSINDAPLAPALTDTTAEDTPVDIDLLAGATDADGDTLVVVAHSDPPTGTLTCTPPGSACTFTPAANTSGTVTFTVTIGDGTTTTTVVRTIEVTPVNDAPVAAVTTATVVEDTPTSIDVRSAATDADPGDVVSLVAATQPAHGTVTCDLAAGTCLYSPAPNYAGTDTFSYTLTDSSGATVTTTVTVTVTPVNDAPTPGSGTGTTPEDTPLTVPVAYVLANDTDPDLGDTFAAISFSQPAHGVASCLPVRAPGVPYQPSDLCTYTPAANWFGTDSFTYTVRDAGGLEGTATITVIVTPVNDAPTVVDEDVTVAEDGVLGVDVLANDSDIDGDPIVIAAITQPRFGTVDCGTLPGPGGCTYRPGPNFNGTDSFTYQVVDQPASGGGGSAAGIVRITVTPVDDPPQAPDRALNTLEDLALDFDALDGVVDPEATAPVFVGVTQPASGTVACSAAGACTYTPPADFSGTVTFAITVADAGGLTATSTITVVVDPVNDPPVAGPDTLTIQEDAAPTALDLLANDVDPEGAALVDVTITTQPVLGTISCNPAGACTYTPNPNATGTDRFGYSVSDGSLTTAGTITIVIEPVADAPVIVDDEVSTPEDTEVVIPVLGNDIDLDGGVPGNVTIVSEPSSGEVRVNPDTGAIGFVPAPNFNGDVTFTYSACGQSGQCAVATVTVHVLPVPDDPVAEQASAVTNPGVPVLLDPLAVDGDADDDLVVDSLALTSQPAHGTATIVAGTGAAGVVTLAASSLVVRYVPDADYLGVDQLDYRICDTRDVCASSLLVITIVPPSLPPIARDDGVTTPVDTSVVIPVLLNDNSAADAAGVIDPTSVTVFAPPAHGTFTIDPVTGQITYTPAAGFVGVDTLSYSVCSTPAARNGEGDPIELPRCATANVRIDVLAPPTPPTDPGTTEPPPSPPGSTVTPTSPGGTLPRTGQDIGIGLAVAGLLVVLGAVARRGARRRRA